MNIEQIIEKYSEYTELTEQDLNELLAALGLKKQDSNKNAQILAHGAGKRGVDNLGKIMNKEGLEIVRKEHSFNNEKNSGLLSTNVCANDARNNEINTKRLMEHGFGGQVNGKVHNIITAIPLTIGDIVLGKIVKTENSDRHCTLDDLDITNIPKELHLGVLKTDPLTGKTQFKLNKNFFALNKENQKNAEEAILKIFKNSKYGSPDKYYGHLKRQQESARLFEENGLEVPKAKRLKPYQQDALETQITKHKSHDNSYTVSEEENSVDEELESMKNMLSSL